MPETLLHYLIQHTNGIYLIKSALMNSATKFHANIVVGQIVENK